MISDLDLTGKIVVVEGFADPLCLFHCGSGFGCSPSAIGQKISGEFLSDKEQTNIRRGNVVRVATDEDMKLLEAWNTKTPAEKFVAQYKTYTKQIDEKFQELETRFGSGKASKKPTRDEMLEEYNYLWRQYRRIDWLVTKHMEFISKEETK